MPRIKLIYCVPIAAAAVFVLRLVQIWQSVPPGNDFYAPYVGAQRLLAGLSPYGPEASDALAAVWHDPFAQAGIAYPLPFLLLVVPFAFAAFPLAALLWSALGLALGYTAAFVSRSASIARRDPAWYGVISLALPFAFWPFFRALRIGQASLLWFGLAALLLLALQRRRIWLVALCVALLPLKPQTGLIFALYGAWWLWHNHRRGLALSAVTGSFLLILSLTLQPYWIGEWVAQVRVYNDFVNPPSLALFAPPLLLAFWRLRAPWWVMAAILQATVFPISDVYSALPILLVWCAFAPPLALLGAALSWLPLLTPFANSGLAIGLFILLPPLLVALWPAQGRRRGATLPQPSVHPS